jgi:hypothetical protein
MQRKGLSIVQIGKKDFQRIITEDPHRPSLMQRKGLFGYQGLDTGNNSNLESCANLYYLSSQGMITGGIRAKRTRPKVAAAEAFSIQTTTPGLAADEHCRSSLQYKFLKRCILKTRSRQYTVCAKRQGQYIEQSCICIEMASGQETLLSERRQDNPS